jgi:hypothetical protein
VGHRSSSHLVGGHAAAGATTTGEKLQSRSSLRGEAARETGRESRESIEKKRREKQEAGKRPRAEREGEKAENESRRSRRERESNAGAKGPDARRLGKCHTRATWRRGACMHV